MLKSFDVLFACSIRNKLREAKKILSNNQIKLHFFKSQLQEIQANSLEKIATKKAADAYNKCKKPVIVEDDGLFIESLNGFPGPYSSFVFNTVGNKGILKLVKTQRNAVFQSVIAFCNKKNNIILFKANLKGKISKNPRGKGWGYDPIFIPDGKNETYAMIRNKNEISHRYKALKKFSNWFVRKRVSSDR